VLRRTALFLAALAAACRGEPARIDGPMLLGGKLVQAETLRAGRAAYLVYCRTCHGERGDGKGPSAAALRPPPRDFTLGQIEFAAVPAGSLPLDEDIVRIVRGGLRGTAMLAWEGVPDQSLDAIVQYLKTFSPRWRDEGPGEAISATPDPWTGEEAAVVRGRKVYHGVARCHSCHPAYASRREIRSFSLELTGLAAGDFREDLYHPVAGDSDWGARIVATDFTSDDLRSVRDGHRMQDLYRVIAAGVGGTAMPTWKGSLPEEDLWALAHYVKSLADIRDRPEARQLLRRTLASDEGDGR
jgi:mono/diheme cytochrome c family protein